MDSRSLFESVPAKKARTSLSSRCPLMRCDRVAECSRKR
jgi:hypothetical protein